jgi:predicted SAM-dependent methyltransferase
MSRTREKVLVEVGPGESPRLGYIHCDIHSGDSVDYVCNAWEIPFKAETVDEVYARHVLEHLTFKDAQRTLKHWLCVLTVGGRIDINVPDLEKHIEQFSQSGDSPYVNFRVTNRDHAMAGFYGWQHNDRDIHKWGYTHTALCQLLQDTGFSSIKRIEDNSRSGHLNLRVIALKERSFPDITVDSEVKKTLFCYCWKRFMRQAASKITIFMRSKADRAAGGGERQAAPTIDTIRPDHRGRYEFVASVIPEGSTILDIACGVGYGSYIMAHKTQCERIAAVDVSSDAIAYGTRYYSSPKISYICSDCLTVVLQPESFDCIVCFETIEHIQDDQQLLKKLYQLLKPQGTLLCSTPNQDKMPFSRTSHPFHHRHYTPEQFEALLRGAGFAIAEKRSQHNIYAAKVSDGWSGFFNIAVCKKAAT